MSAETVAILVRHAHADWNPDENRPLSARGHAAAVRLADRLVHLRVDAVYSSPATRAQQTVLPLAVRRNLPVRVVSDLRERELSSEPVDDFLSAVRAVWEDPSFAWPGGESNLTAQRRGVVALEQLLAAHAGEHIVVGTHGNLLALMLQHYDPGVDFEFWRYLTMPDAYRLCIGPDGARFSRIDYTAE